MSPRSSRPSTSSSSSRSSTHATDPNVFSDHYALEALDSHSSSPPDADDDPTPTSTSPLVHPATNLRRPTSPENTTSSLMQPPPKQYKPPRRRDVGAPTPSRTTSRSSNAFSDVHRASSTSSRFSMPRSLSPYVGATGPSHPYGMYPQITRTSSIASASTVRPVERPFVAPNGPEHPYAMYPQNTVPEEDDLSMAQATIPLGFPGMGQQYQSIGQTRPSDIADIVGPDGHVEELPPYTRYADEVAPKESPLSLRGVTLPTVMPDEVPMSPQSTHTRYSDNNVELNTAASRSTGSDSSGSFKEKIKRKGRQRACGGLPFWFIFAIIGVLLLGVIVGATIGGVVGSRKAALAHGDAESFQNSSLATATVTATEFLDAIPLPTDHPVLNVPNGQFNVPTDSIGVSSQGCISNPDLTDAWSCMPAIGVGVTIDGQDRNAALIFDPYPVNASFLYGAQPPNFGSQRIPLIPSTDVDSNDLGPSLFAGRYYDKLTIVHEDDFLPNGNYKRNGPERYAEPGQRPWFCWFNQTILEVFIYVNQRLDSAATAAVNTPHPASTPSIVTSVKSSSPTPHSPPPATAWPPIPSPDLATATAAAPTAAAPTSVVTIPATQPSIPPGRVYDDDDDDDDDGDGDDRRVKKMKKRDWANDDRRNNYTDYPLLIKIKEQRQPSGNVQPYCQQMQILEEDLRIVPASGVEIVQVPEEEGPWGETTAVERLVRRGSDGVGCACEWVTG